MSQCLEEDPLESLAKQQLEEMYSEDENEADQKNVHLNIYDISGWNTPRKKNQQTEKITNLSDNDPKKNASKNTLQHLSENLERYHKQANGFSYVHRKQPGGIVSIPTYSHRNLSRPATPSSTAVFSQKTQTPTQNRLQDSDQLSKTFSRFAPSSASNHISQKHQIQSPLNSTGFSFKSVQLSTKRIGQLKPSMKKNIINAMNAYMKTTFESNTIQNNLQFGNSNSSKNNSNFPQKYIPFVLSDLAPQKISQSTGRKDHSNGILNTSQPLSRNFKTSKLISKDLHYYSRPNANNDTNSVIQNPSINSVSQEGCNQLLQYAHQKQKNLELEPTDISPQAEMSFLQKSNQDLHPSKQLSSSKVFNKPHQRMSVQTNQSLSKTISQEIERKKSPQEIHQTNQHFNNLQQSEQPRLTFNKLSHINNSNYQPETFLFGESLQFSANTSISPSPVEVSKSPSYNIPLFQQFTPQPKQDEKCSSQDSSIKYQKDIQLSSSLIVIYLLLDFNLWCRKIFY